MKIDTFPDKEYWTVEHPDDLLAWEIIHIEDWKEGVKRLHVRNAALPNEFRFLYCKTDILRERDRLRYPVLDDEIVYEDILDAEVID